MAEKSKVIIATHSGQFHADDVFAVATLCLVLEKDYNIEIIRTRDKEIIEKADYVVDVGHTYDESKNRFDHHQGGAGGHTNGIPFAAFGLVWNTYGGIVAGDRLIASKLDQKLVTPIDAIDNGKEILTPMFDDVSPYTIDNFIASYKVTWRENSEDLYDRFIYLVIIAKGIITREIKVVRDEEEAKVIVEEIYRKSENKSLIILDAYYPWRDVMSGHDDTRLVIYPDMNGNNWDIEVVRDEDFVNTRISLPETWAGKRDTILEEATGVKGSIFCHIDRFFAVAKTKESAIELAQKALNQ